MRIGHRLLVAALVLGLLYVGTCFATDGDDEAIEHQWAIELPHSPERLWALMQDYDSWPEYAPMVIAVEVLHPGDESGNGGSDDDGRGQQILYRTGP